MRSGAAQVVREEELEPPRFRALIEELLLPRAGRERMAAAAARLGHPRAAVDMAAHLLESLDGALAERGWLTEVGE